MAPHAAPTVGRRTELGHVEACLGAVDAGDARCLAVEGEAGIGKTRLLEELARGAEARGHLVLGGCAAEFERDLPFGVWVDALDAYLAAQERELGVELADLASVAPSLARRHGLAGGGGPGDQRHRTHRAVRVVLDGLAQDRPLVLVLDDLHWCDGASLELISALVRRPPTTPVLLALAFRTGQVPARFAATIASGGAVPITLEPLGEAESLTLAGDGGDAAGIVAESGGNPFYILQLARATRIPSLTSSGDELAIGAGVPRTVAATLAEELDNLSPDARALVRGAAIAGDPFEPELAFDVARLDAEPGIAALDELLGVRMLHPTAIPRRFAFRHPLVRRAVYSTTPAGWRSGGHARAALALAARGASDAARAHHVEQSAVAGDPAAIAVLLAAGRADAPRAPAGAARWFAAALRLMPAADVAVRRETLIALAHAGRSTGDLEHSAARLLEALDLVPADDTGQRVRLAAACAACEHFLGRHERAERRLADCLATVPDGDSPTVVVLLLAQAVSAFFSLDVDGGCRSSRRALETARRVEDPVLVMSAAAALAHAAANAGAIADAAAALDEATATLDALPDATAAAEIDAINRVAWSEFLLERDEAAIRHARRGITIARATGQDQFVPMLCGALAHALMRSGDLAGAATTQAEALETAELTANGYVTSWVLTTTAAVLVATGDLDAARRASEQAVALVEGLEGGRIGAMAGVRLALTLRELGATEDATADLVALAGGWDLPLIPPSWRVPYLEALTRIELQAGAPAAAVRRAAAARDDAGGLGLPVAGVVATRAEAGIALEGGDAAAAADTAARAADGAECAPLERARTLALAGRACAAAGERRRAVALLRDAERVFDTAGALTDRGAARRELRRLGARVEPRGPSGRADSGVASLSTREREVADLVVARRTNREVAAALFLSEKTVESHLRNVFFKLGVSSRADVARAVEAETRPSRT